jgi:endonuclease/exonuclease/phosphatase family metal-dependent hydrolase
LTVPTVIGVPVSLPWAWASVDATLSGRSFRFATTHLDPISGAAQQLQLNEFLAGPGSTTLPIVWVGDFNSDAEATALARQHAQEAKMPFELWRGRQIVYRSVAPLTGRYEVPDPSAA